MLTRATILLADDHVLLLAAFRRMLEPAFEVVGAAADGAALVEEALRLEPDLVVADVSMPRMNGLEAARRLRGELPRTRVVFLTVNEDPQMAAEAFALGASGYVLKSSTALELDQAIRAVLAGRRYLSKRIAGGDPALLPAPAMPSNPLERLTRRERDVLKLLAEGLSMKQVGAELGIAARTVAFHKYRMMETLELRSSAELVGFAVENRLT
jgi:DNA-binding NarL/FixJ family response regulator